MDNETWKIIIAHLSDETDEQAAIRVQQWLSEDPLHQDELEQARWIWMATALRPEKEEWKENFEKLKPQLLETAAPVIHRLNPNHKLRWLAIAATFTGLALFISFYVYQKEQHQKKNNENIVWITKKAEAGKVISITLPDSSEIWLNSGSSLSFPQNIKQAAVRMVRLKGEAFFNVKRDASHPFIVQSRELQTRVLGTSFNINAWPDRKTEVTVLTGKVAVSKTIAGKQSSVYLLPNQKVVDRGIQHQLAVENIKDADEVNSWMEGKMIFNQLPLESIFKVIERKYQVSIRTEQNFADCKLTANFRNVSLSEVMQTLKATLAITYTIKGQTVYIKGGRCN